MPRGKLSSTSFIFGPREWVVRDSRGRLKSKRNYLIALFDKPDQRGKVWHEVLSDLELLSLSVDHDSALLKCLVVGISSKHTHLDFNLPWQERFLDEAYGIKREVGSRFKIEDSPKHAARISYQLELSMLKEYLRRALERQDKDDISEITKLAYTFFSQFANDLPAAPVESAQAKELIFCGAKSETASSNIVREAFANKSLYKLRNLNSSSGWRLEDYDRSLRDKISILDKSSDFIVYKMPSAQEGFGRLLHLRVDPQRDSALCGERLNNHSLSAERGSWHENQFSRCSACAEQIKSNPHLVPREALDESTRFLTWDHKRREDYLRTLAQRVGEELKLICTDKKTPEEIDLDEIELSSIDNKLNTLCKREIHKSVAATLLEKHKEYLNGSSHKSVWHYLIPQERLEGFVKEYARVGFKPHTLPTPNEKMLVSILRKYKMNLFGGEVEDLESEAMVRLGSLLVKGKKS